MRSPWKTRDKLSANWNSKAIRPRLGEQNRIVKIRRNGTFDAIPGYRWKETGVIELSIGQYEYKQDKKGVFKLYKGKREMTTQTCVHEMTTESESRETSDLPVAPDEQYGEVF